MTGKRSATGGSLVHNTAVPPVKIDAVDGTVRLEGEVLAVDRSRRSRSAARICWPDSGLG